MSGSGWCRKPWLLLTGSWCPCALSGLNQNGRLSPQRKLAFSVCPSPYRHQAPFPTVHCTPPQMLLTHKALGPTPPPSINHSLYHLKSLQQNHIPKQQAFSGRRMKNSGNFPLMLRLFFPICLRSGPQPSESSFLVSHPPSPTGYPAPSSEKEPHNVQPRWLIPFYVTLRRSPGRRPSPYKPSVRPGAGGIDNKFQDTI